MLKAGLMAKPLILVGSITCHWLPRVKLMFPDGRMVDGEDAAPKAVPPWKHLVEFHMVRLPLLVL
jgi:hypothetical protein